jgi:hypothetical protein
MIREHKLMFWINISCGLIKKAALVGRWSSVRALVSGLVGSRD